MSDLYTDPFADDAGAYVLGTLDEADRAAFVDHLRGCPECRQAVAEIEDLPGLLALVPAEGPVDPPPTVLAHLLDEVRRQEWAERSRARRRRTWWGGAGLAAAAAGAVVFSGSLVPMPWTEPPAVVAEVTTVDFEPTADAAITASLELTSVRWGTKIELTCSYQGDQYAQPVEYALVVHDAEGRSEQVATWIAVPGRELTIPAATGLALEDITRVEMISDGAVMLVAEV
jgi:hypothetical protein